MSDVTEAYEAVQQLREAMDAVLRDYGSSSDKRDLPGLSVRWAESSFSFWNCIALTDPGQHLLGERLAQAADIMRGKRQQGLVWHFEDLIDPAARNALPDAAAKAGLTLSLTGYGMAGDILPLPDPVHPDLRFARVTTEDALTAYADLNADAYGLPRQAARGGLCGKAIWTRDVHAFIGLKNGVPVSCAGSMALDGRLFVILVATAPAEQRRGFGEAVTRKALHEGSKATGLTRATLHATEAGVPVYERIGLKRTARINFYGLRA